MDDIEFNDDLHELNVLADRILSTLDTAPLSEVLITLNDAYEPTVYSGGGRKPAWPWWASDTFAELWASR